jgi:ABC-type phosphate/phosphonate transport system substrate-binding protein
MKHFLLTATLVAILGMRSIAAEPFIIAVMDPLAEELACACIDGFAQRNYKALADHLKKTGTPAFEKVELVFAGSLPAAITKSTPKRVDMIIGKDSVVRAELQAAKMPATAIARLTNKEGSTDFTGLVIVAADDPATSIADLKDHRLLFGPPESKEKHIAGILLFSKHGVNTSKLPETVDRCSEAGFMILENESDKKIAAVISDYALALLEGCETIEKGALRVIDKTEPVPFIAVFVAGKPDPFDEDIFDILYRSLLACKTDDKLLKALETKDGFVPYISGKGASTWEPLPVAQEAGDTKN